MATPLTHNPLLRALALLGGVEAVALLRHRTYGIGFAYLMGMVMTAKYLLCMIYLPVFHGQVLVLSYATLLVGINSVAALARTLRGTTVPPRYTGHSYLWNLGFSTHTLMLRIEPLLAGVLAGVVLLTAPRGLTLAPLQWPYTSLQPLLGDVSLSPAWLAVLQRWGGWIALAQALALPVGVWCHNAAEYDALPGPVASPSPLARTLPELGFAPVAAAHAPALPVPSAARLAVDYAAPRPITSTQKGHLYG